jgi:uncharacterized protein (DUF885 family)
MKPRCLKLRACLVAVSLILAVAVGLALTAETSIDADAANVTSLADEFVRDFVARNPEIGTFMGLAEAPSDRLSDNSLASLKAWQAREDNWLTRLAAINGSSLWGRPEWVTYGFLREALEGSKASRG